MEMEDWLKPCSFTVVNRSQWGGHRVRSCGSRKRVGLTPLKVSTQLHTGLGDGGSNMEWRVDAVECLRKGGIRRGRVGGGG